MLNVERPPQAKNAPPPNKTALYHNLHRRRKYPAGKKSYSESANAETKASAVVGAWAAEMKLHSNCDGAM